MSLVPEWVGMGVCDMWPLEPVCWMLYGVHGSMGAMGARAQAAARVLTLMGRMALCGMKSSHLPPWASRAEGAHGSRVSHGSLGVSIGVMGPWDGTVGP